MNYRIKLLGNKLSDEKAEISVKYHKFTDNKTDIKPAKNANLPKNTLTGNYQLKSTDNLLAIKSG